MDSIVKVENLVKRYGDLIALDHLGFEVTKGEIFGLLGPNGSGKSTAIGCILSLLKYDKGNIEVFGRPMSPSAYSLKRDIGVIMQNVAVFDELTVYENIFYFCGLYVSDRKRCEELTRQAIDFTGLGDYRDFRPKKLSGGLLRRLNIACGIVHRPKLIILDEPTVAVDPQSRNNILEGIEKLNREGATVIYTSHYMEEVEQICTRVAIMDKGRIIAEGTTDELKGMISAGERVTVELFGPAGGLCGELSRLPGVVNTEAANGQLVVKSSRGNNNLTAVLEFLKSRKVRYGKIYCELPTLNDVFLEITGKQLRD